MLCRRESMMVEDGIPNSSSGPKVRLVKCPKCRQVLQESADIPIYRCGGCGIILQAKHRKNDLKIMGPDHQKNGEIPPKETNNASEDKDSGSLTRDVRVPSSAENSVDFEEVRDQSISFNGDYFMPKEETPVCMDGDQLGGHDRRNAEDNGERDGESGGIQSSTELESHENGGSSPIDERNSEREASRESSPVPHDNPTEETKGSALKDHEMIKSGSSSGDNSMEKPAEEITPIEAPFSKGAREEQFKRTSSHTYSRRMTMESTASTEYVDPVSDFSGTLAETTRSPAGNIFRYNHGDLHSYDATETYHSNHNVKKADSGITRERFSQGKYHMNSDSEMRYPEINSRPPLSFSQEDGFVQAGGRVRVRTVEPPARGSEGRHWRRPDTGELPPRIPENHWQQRSYYDYGGPSNQVPSYSRFNSGIHSGNVPTHPELEKMKLLRMVHDLEDQLKITCNLEEISRERMPPGSHWRERPSDFYYGRDRMDEDYLRMGLPAYSRIDEDSRWRHHSRYPRRPFSAEMVETSHQPNNFYQHPVDWRRSEPLPPPPAAHNGKFHGIRNNKSIYSPYSSSPSSPQHYMDYGFSPYGYDTRSDDEVYDKEKEYEKYREDEQMAKRRVMAAAGGAPWIICSRCSRLLQLPTDFLLFKKKCHRLRCGSCSTVLKFSLQSRRHLVPYIRRAEAPPPPSEADERSDSLRVNTLPLDSRLNDFMPAEIVSYSDDIGMSYSTEGDPGCLAMLQSVGDHLDDSLEAEGLQDSGSSPLHRLMGYSSVSQVFKGTEPSAKDATSSVSKRP